MNKVVNDFSITVGTKNGSGSSTANNTLLRSIFKMGIPVSGKNLFPSNIQGLPTWYTIRANKDGFIARQDTNDIVIAINPDSFAKDLASVSKQHGADWAAVLGVLRAQGERGSVPATLMLSSSPTTRIPALVMTKSICRTSEHSFMRCKSFCA